MKGNNDMKSFIRNAFKKWIKKNRRNFIYHPVLFIDRRDCLEFRLRGVTHFIRIHISKYDQFEIRVYFRGECWDMLGDFDLSVARDRAGRYYCSQCLPEHKEYYSSRYELFEKHTFDPFLEWISEKINKDNYLCFGATHNRGITYAEIKKKSEIDENTYIKIVPLISK